MGFIFWRSRRDLNFRKSNLFAVNIRYFILLCMFCEQNNTIFYHTLLPFMIV